MSMVAAEFISKDDIANPILILLQSSKLFFEQIRACAEVATCCTTYYTAESGLSESKLCLHGGNTWSYAPTNNL